VKFTLAGVFDPSVIARMICGGSASQFVRVPTGKATAETSLENVLECNVYSASVEKFAAVNAIYARYFPKDPPALTPRRCPRVRGVWRGADHSLSLRASRPLWWLRSSRRASHSV
jgi:Endoribonuclease L-PSP